MDRIAVIIKKQKLEMFEGGLHFIGVQFEHKKNHQFAEIVENMFVTCYFYTNLSRPTSNASITTTAGS